ncbi:protein DpdD [Mycolicibacterium elephantis]|uniref:protein DpdD n=1 Tax=Mycolicibacterium elephantis TaxID=81858 RepID=UPI003A84ABE1
MNDLIEQFFGASNELDVDRLPEGFRVQLNEWIEDLRAGDRTAFLPRVHGSRLFWYIFAPGDRRANEILELLIAWVGPTYSDISQTRGRLDLTDAFDSRVASLSPLRVLRFEVLPRTGSSATTQARKFVRSALTRLTQLLDNRPPSEFQLAKSTAEILDDLGHALSARDRSAADAALDELTKNGDLDVVNLSFVRIRALGALEEWEELLSDRAIADVIGMQRPPGVTRTVRRAVYRLYFGALDQAERDSEMLATVDALPDEYRGLGRGPTAKHPDELVLQVLLVLKSGAPNVSELAGDLIAGADALRPGLKGRLQRLIAAASPTEIPSTIAIDPETAAFDRYLAGDAKGALAAVLELPPSAKTFQVAAMAATDLEDDESARLTLEYISRDQELRKEVSERKQIRHFISDLQARVATTGPDNWASWLDLIATGANPAEVSAAVTDDDTKWTPLTFDELSSRVEGLSDDALMVLGEVSGQLLAAHRDAIESAGAAGAALGRRLLEALAVGMKASAGIQAQTLNLIDLAFSSSFARQEYANTLEYIGTIKKTNSSPGTADWQTDLLQIVTSYPDADESSGTLTNFVSSSINDLIPFRYALSRTAIRAIELICQERDMQLPSIFVTATTDDTEEEVRQYSYLAGKTVAIYSLMQPTVSRAAQLLRKLVPTADVKVYAAKDGDDMLASASENADVFVMVTAAAKHAATLFIEAHRGNRKLIRVNSKGTSAIMRALQQTD